MKTILFESEHVLVSYLEGGGSSSAVFVTFNEIGYRPNGANFWGDSFFAKLQVSAVGVVSKRPNWYPAADMLEATALIKAATPGACRITYGISQGGYGALKYAAALEATAALAFGPQWSIDPADVGDFDKRFARYYEPGLDGGRRIVAEDVGPAGFVFFDPHHAIDAQNAARLLELPGVEAVLTPFCGHSPMQVITEAHGGVAFFQDAAHMIQARRPAHEIGARLRTHVRAARAKSALYASERSSQLRTRSKLSLLAGLRRRDPESLTPATLLFVAVRENDADEVNRLMPMLKLADVNAAGPIAVWQFVRQTGLKEAEVRLADLLIGESKSPFLRLHGVKSYIDLNLRHMARLALRDIVASHDLANHQHLALQFAQTLGMADVMPRVRETLAAV